MNSVGRLLCLVLGLLLGPLQSLAGHPQQALVLSSIKPLHLIVRALVGERVDARVLPGAQVSPHEFVLRPSDLRLVRDASELFWIGPRLEKPLDEVLQRLPQPPHNVALLSVSGLHSGGDEAAMDPHIWLDPQLAARMARLMAQTLIDHAILPEPQIRPGLAGFEAAMSRTERQIGEMFVGLQEVPFMAMHDAWGYFVRRFALNQVATLAITAEHPHGARSIGRMRDEARQSGAVCLLREPFSNPRLAQTVAEGTDMEVLELDALALSAPDTEQAYADFLLSMAETLAGCLRRGQAAAESNHE